MVGPTAIEMSRHTVGALMLPEAICLDLDGTLYSQRPLRLIMTLRLARTVLSSPREAIKTIRVVSAYRRAQESLRDSTKPCDIARAQIALTCQFTGYDVQTVTERTAVWFDHEPLRFLQRFIRPGLREFLTAAKARGIKLAILSDYPAELKLAAMNLHDYFDIVMTAQDPAIGCFKPSPAGLHCIAKRFGIEPSRMLYIGDRPEVDAEAARRAGMRSIIIHSGKHPADSVSIHVKTFLEAKQALGI